VENIVTLTDVSLSYVAESGETQALDNINLEVRRGEFLGIVGPSGCGKSTLLSLVTDRRGARPPTYCRKTACLIGARPSEMPC